ncbi:MAG TPA: MarR family winged helix-turn-helix transcriptional regulator, partial [Ktedonobacterales bacterium]|nr:MarR family winged helix-turn-helix transcriptional regulator [Ktedonobacterales bacterium]
MGDMPQTDRRLPLPALLSFALVAFTIEFDNEFEHQAPHRTTWHGATADSPHALWLVSLAMWANCMQFVDDGGITLRELTRRARTTTNLDGMLRWGYIVIKPNPALGRSKQPRADSLIRSTPAGRKAQEIWRPLAGVIEQRWQARFGAEEIAQLRAALWAVVRQLDDDLPDCLPMLRYGLFSPAVSSGHQP